MDTFDAKRKTGDKDKITTPVVEPEAGDEVYDTQQDEANAKGVEAVENVNNRPDEVDDDRTRAN